MSEKSYKLRAREVADDTKYPKNDEHYTPKIVFDRTIGHADYDPATTEDKAKEFGINIFDTIETDGLTTDWAVFNRIWINPPFTLKKEFVRKAIKTVNENEECSIFVLLPIESLTTNWFYDVTVGYDLFIPRGRIKFEDPRNPKAKSPTFGSVIVKFSNYARNEIINFNMQYCEKDGL
ncbi:DNA N-6-adenine-methyltransferase [Leuconostoc mesenteroides]|uniref:DNA N-6-adenine-methyltransferase n=1 Tax=Leuconostoc mesenteroides TaxID=1245 RepID=UPI00235F0150|nr:DNA N-6-adenine-methyltransferase [Leuconostoc mesenteroides]